MQGPTHLQLACIMGERTADERASFGKIKGEFLDINETNIEWVIEQY